MRARALFTLAGEKPARGAALSAPLHKIDYPEIIVENGRISSIEHARPSHSTHQDLGDTILLPPLVNAHTHTQLSWLDKRTLWKQGFGPWLRSMVPPLLAAAKGEGEEYEACLKAVGEGWKQIGDSGTGWVGDIGGSLPGLLERINKAAQKNNLGIMQFCEWFGFGPDMELPWPPRCRKDIGAYSVRNFSNFEPYGLALHGANVLAPLAFGRAAKNGRFAFCKKSFAKCSSNEMAKLAPCGHALYSTSGEILRKVKEWCRHRGHVFTFHLAESEDETRALKDGKGEIVDFYRGKVLPDDWQAPGMRPLAYALSLGLLDANTLAVHGVQLENEEMDILAQSGAALCLCPRSNINLGLGLAPVKKLMAKGVLLCLGTDGLTSNTDLDLRNEAIFLRQNLDIPWPALTRMLTVNGAAALGLPDTYGKLATGYPARFCAMPANSRADME